MLARNVVQRHLGAQPQGLSRMCKGSGAGSVGMAPSEQLSIKAAKACVQAVRLGPIFRDAQANKAVARPKSLACVNLPHGRTKAEKPQS